MSRRPYAARVPIEVRRDQLLDAALAVLVRKGYAGVSVEAIARQAGVTRPVVYGAFDGLGPLLGALLDRQQARALSQLADALRPDGELVDAVGRLVDVVLADPDTWRPILMPAAGMPEAVRRRIDGDREAVRRQIQHQLAGAEDPELAAHAVVGALQQLGGVVLAQPERFERDRLVAFARGLLGALTR